MPKTGFELIQDALLRCVKIPSEIGSLRSVMEAGVDRAAQILGKQDEQFVEELMATKDLFKDPQALESALPRSKLVELITRQKIANAQLAVNAACLVFTHGTVDGVAFDCCRAITLLDPNRCLRWVEDRSFKVSEIMSERPENLLRMALDARLEWLERRALPEKADFVYRSCPPAAGWKGPTSYTYDRDRLARVDDVRHRTVHDGMAAVRDLQDGDEQFLEQTGLHLVLLVVTAFGLKFDPETLARLVGSPAAS